MTSAVSVSCDPCHREPHVVFDFTVLGKKMMLQFLNFSDIKAVSSLCDVYFKKRTAIQILYNYLLVREVILPEVVAILPS